MIRVDAWDVPRLGIVAGHRYQAGHGPDVWVILRRGHAQMLAHPRPARPSTGQLITGLSRDCPLVEIPAFR